MQMSADCTLAPTNRPSFARYITPSRTTHAHAIINLLLPLLLVNPRYDPILAVV